MPRTYQNAIDEARELLQDTLEPYRYGDPTLLNKLNRGLQELARIRPDAFWAQFNTGSGEIDVPEIESGDLGDDFEPPMQFFAPIVYFITGSAELIDDEFVTDGRAMTLLAGFKQQVIGI
jgi:hypothetical protein